MDLSKTAPLYNLDCANLGMLPYWQIFHFNVFFHNHLSASSNISQIPLYQIVLDNDNCVFIKEKERKR
jgi:hypothetical protein